MSQRLFGTSICFSHNESHDLRDSHVCVTQPVLHPHLSSGLKRVPITTKKPKRPSLERYRQRATATGTPPPVADHKATKICNDLEVLSPRIFEGLGLSQIQGNQTTFLLLSSNPLPLPLFFYSSNYLATVTAKAASVISPPTCSSYSRIYPSSVCLTFFVLFERLYWQNPLHARRLTILCSRLRLRPQPRFRLEHLPTVRLVLPSPVVDSFLLRRSPRPVSIPTLLHCLASLTVISSSFWPRPFGFPAWKRDTFLQLETHNRSTWDEERLRSRRSKMTEIALCK